MIKKHQKNNEIIKLEKEIKELKTGWQRTQADFDNFRKKTEIEKVENMAFAKAEFMTKLTPVLDNFYRAFSQIKADDPTTQGFYQIQKQLEDILNIEGLQKIPAQPGTKFDPNFHEAISYEENNLPVDTIIGELESGWMFQDKIVKPAKVRVSKGSTKTN
ncbi:MAG: nucleotide exchange factor GrpE [Patescibacteria group bacterium]|nr:nucleotide exchange factor GrpE [Patescibacteria group bacterium]